MALVNYVSISIGLCFASSNLLADTITVALSPNYVHTSSVSNGNIVVTLTPDPVSLTPDQASAAFMNALDPTNGTGLTNWGAGTNQPITVQYSNALTGTLSFDLYRAVLSGANTGGGQIAVHFNGSPPTGQNLAWIELVTTTDPANPPGASPYLNIFGAGYTPANGYDLLLPFFYRPDVTMLDNVTGVTGGLGIRNSNYTINGTNYNYNPGIAFDQPPQRSYTDHTITWTGDLLLASWTGPLEKPPGGGYGATTLTVYQGIQWGWTISAVPEPSSITYALAGSSLFLVMLARRWRRKRGDEQQRIPRLGESGTRKPDFNIRNS